VVTIYGIANCDKCRAAIKWFEQQNCEYRFHDLRADGLDKKLLKRWATHTPGAELINKRSTTWRSIPASRRETSSETELQALILEHPTLIKRPLVDDGAEVLLGYDEAQWKHLLA
jgi:arsenate reductase